MAVYCPQWNVEFARAYRAAGYWTDEVLGRWPGGLAERADRPALVSATGVVTYAELDATVERRAAGLLAIGLRPGDTVVVQLANEPELIVLCLALFRAGICPVLALPAHRAVEISQLAELSGAVAYVCSQRLFGFDYREMAREVLRRASGLRHVLVSGDPGPYTALSTVNSDPVDLPAPDPKSVAMLLLSGGTSGTPKLIGRTHADYAYQLRETATVCGIGPQSRYLAVLPVEHNFALGCPGVLGVLRAGGAAVLALAPTPDVCFPLIETAGVTHASLVPPLVPLWLDAADWFGADLSSLTVLQVGGARLDAGTAAQIRPALHCQLQQVYGMAEGLLNFTRLDDPDDEVYATQGRPLSPADELRIVDGDGREVVEGQPGELLTRGPYTLPGYFRAPEHNRGRFTGDGFFRTGDRVCRTPSGNLQVLGRMDDVINRGGEKVPAGEVEGFLLRVPGVRSAAVVGRGHPLLGEETVAFVVPEDPGAPPTLRALRAALTGEGLAAYKLPDVLEIVAGLSVTAVGKIDKKALIELGRSAQPLGR